MAAAALRIRSGGGAHVALTGGTSWGPGRPAVFRMGESSDSMKNATATSHGSSSFADSIGGGRSCVANRGEELGAPNAIRLGARMRAPAHRSEEHTSEL